MQDAFKDVVFIAKSAFKATKFTAKLIVSGFKISKHTINAGYIFTKDTYNFCNNIQKLNSKKQNFVKKRYKKINSKMKVFFSYYFVFSYFFFTIFNLFLVKLKFSLDALKVLKEWFEINRLNPYASKKVKAELAKKTNLSLKSITYWLLNKRRRIKNQSITDSK